MARTVVGLTHHVYKWNIWKGTARPQLGQQEHVESSPFRESWAAVGAESEWHICLGQCTPRDHRHLLVCWWERPHSTRNNIENEELLLVGRREWKENSPKQEQLSLLSEEASREGDFFYRKRSHKDMSVESLKMPANFSLASKMEQ